jgi:hypothetical protein
VNSVPLREQLDSFDENVRRQALASLVAANVAGRLPVQPGGELFNMHCHTFFSYSGYGYSPSALAWLAKEAGWWALAKVDFDVLDGIDETLEAGDAVQVRAAAGVETRVYLPELCQWEFNSPGEPGVLYYVGMGFAGEQVPAEAAIAIGAMRERAADRNREMVGCLNDYLAPVAVDYSRDVLPLTPSGNATERHILVAYDRAARAAFPAREALLAFWANKLGMSAEQVGAFMGDEPYPHDAIRGKLMKRGGVGYIQPGPATFPPLDAVNEAMMRCGAVTTYAFLDGASEGEQRLRELLELLSAKGMAGLTVIPDRNWNYADPGVRAAKVRQLDIAIELARKMGLPVIAGTEMNKPGQRQIDDFGAEPLRPYWQDLRRGAAFVYGHTFMQRTLGLGFHSAWAASMMPLRSERNGFYARVGELAQPGKELLAKAGAWAADREPGWYLQQLRGASRQ